MLASITPLGERSRGFSWRVTAAWFAFGSIAAGALAGLMLGALGSLLPAGLQWRTAAAAVVIAAAVIFDVTPMRRWLPSSRRQVNEDWLGRYRGWVYGLGFGAQLGVGIVTIVTSATVYAAVLLALLAPGSAAGALIGGAFGAGRALSLAPARTVTDPARLAALHRRVVELESTAKRAVLALELLALVLLLGALV